MRWGLEALHCIASHGRRARITTVLEPDRASAEGEARHLARKSCGPCAWVCDRHACVARGPPARLLASDARIQGSEAPASFFHSSMPMLDTWITFFFSIKKTWIESYLI